MQEFPRCWERILLGEADVEVFFMRTVPAETLKQQSLGPLQGVSFVKVHYKTLTDAQSTLREFASTGNNFTSTLLLSPCNVTRIAAKDLVALNGVLFPDLVPSTAFHLSLLETC